MGTKRLVSASNGEVLYRCEVRVSDYFLSVAFFFTQKQKLLEKGHFIDLSNEYKFTYVPM